jgi:hypothetical protein
MGQEYFRRPLYAPEFDADRAYNASTNGVRAGRIVRFHTDGSVRPTTGSSGRAAVGITLTSASSGTKAVVRMFGIANVVASTAALAIGAFVRGCAGASTSSSAGTGRASTNANASAIGVALTSRAAGAISSTRTVQVFITHSGQVLV